MDGYVTIEVPVLPLRDMGATRVIAVRLPGPAVGLDPQNHFGVMNRTFRLWCSGWKANGGRTPT